MPEKYWFSLSLKLNLFALLMCLSFGAPTTTRAIGAIKLVKKKRLLTSRDVKLNKYAENKKEKITLEEAHPWSLETWKAYKTPGTT